MLAPVRIQDHFPVAPEKQLEEIVLYDGAVVPNGSDVPLTEAITSQFTEIWVKGTDPAAVLTRWGKIDPKDLLNGSAERITIYEYAGSGTATTESGVRIVLASSTSSSLRVDAASTFGSPVGVSKVVGYRKRYVTETKQVTIPVTPDWVSSGSFVNTDEVTVNQRYTIDASKLPSDFRNADGTIKDSVKAIVQLDPLNNGRWAELKSDSYYASSTTTLINTGIEVNVFDDEVAVDTAGYGNAHTGTTVNRIIDNALPKPWVGVGTLSSVHCRVKIWNDEKYATSIPVSDKGYGGLVKTTLATAIADFTIPTVINFDAVAITTPLKVVQDITSDTLTLNQIGIWETTGSVKLGFDSAVTDREIVLEVYNETLSQVAFEISVNAPQGQTSVDIPVNIGSLEVLNSGDSYSLRVYSADTFSNVVINKCRWDVKLYSPL